MTKQEFETLTKRTVSDELFDNVNRLYMAAGEMTKQDFCEAWLKLTPSDRGNAIVHDIVEHCEQLARTVDSLNRVIADQATQLDAARENMSSMQRTIDGQKDQIHYRDEKILQMQKVLNAVEEHVDLEIESEVAKAYEEQFGKLYVIKMRHENGWELNGNEIDWLLEHAEE